MRLIFLVLVLFVSIGYSQPDTLDPREMFMKPEWPSEIIPKHNPTINSTQEFQNRVRKRDSLQRAYRRSLRYPSLFGMAQKDSLKIKLYLRSGLCNTSHEYQLFLQLNRWPEKHISLGKSSFRDGALKIIDLKKNPHSVLEDPLNHVERIDIIPIGDSLIEVIVEGRIMNEMCSRSPLKFACKTSGFETINGVELGLAPYEIPDRHFVESRFLLNKSLTIHYDTCAIIMDFHNSKLTWLRMINKQEKELLSFSIAKDGWYYRDFGPFAFRNGVFLLKEDKKHKLEVHSRENAELLCKGKFKNLKPYGKWTYYDTSGIVRAVGKYKQFKDQNGYADQIGAWKFYHPNGQLMAKGKYVTSGDPNVHYTILSDNWLFYDPQGNPVEKKLVVKLYEPKAIVMPLPDYLYEISFLANW